MPDPIPYLPADHARCWGALADDDDLALVWRADCHTCLRRLAPEHPLPGRTQWLAAQPQPCEHHLPAEEP